MSIRKPHYPIQIWNGLTENPWRMTRNDQVNPDFNDWDQIAAEVIIIEESVDKLKKGVIGFPGATGVEGPVGATGASGLQGVAADSASDSGTTSIFRAHAANDQMVPGFQLIKIEFSQLDYDCNNEWDAVNYNYVAKEAGYYSIAASLNLMNYTGASFLQIIKNDSPLKADCPIQSYEQNPQALYCLCVGLVYLEIGDYISAIAIHMNWSPVSVGDNSSTYFCVHKIG